jgi:serine/threonine-protein kinase RsbT
MEDEVRVAIARDEDLVRARAETRALATRLGFSRTDATLIATAVSEIARNILVHADHGQLLLRSVEDPHRCALVVVASDAGPGIVDSHAALQDGQGWGPGLGLGLPGARRLMDEFDLRSEVGRGTTVTMTKWRNRDELEQLREKRRRSRS